jgi:Protein of unknown function (DUF2794)
MIWHEPKGKCASGRCLDLTECEDKEPSGGKATLLAFAARDRSAEISFNRKELNEILKVYGRKVANGEWRDYAIDQLRERAIFSVYRRSSEVPVYRIVKQPRAPRRQGPYSVVAATGLIVERGADLGRVLRVLDRRLTVVA